MKKIVIACLAVVVACMVMAPAADAADAGAAVVLSAVLPGTGEWYNSGFSGAYPFTECIAGCICPLIQFSSIFDAAAGKADANAMRLDFWVTPR